MRIEYDEYSKEERRMVRKIIDVDDRVTLLLDPIIYKENDKVERAKRIVISNKKTNVININSWSSISLTPMASNTIDLTLLD